MLVNINNCWMFIQAAVMRKWRAALQERVFTVKMISQRQSVLQLQRNYLITSIDVMRLVILPEIVQWVWHKYLKKLF